MNQWFVCAQLNCVKILMNILNAFQSIIHYIVISIVLKCIWKCHTLFFLFFFFLLFSIQITKRLGISNGKNGSNGNAPTASAIRNSKINADLNVLDQLVSTLLERQKQSSSPPPPPSTSSNRESTRLSRLKSLSFRNRRSLNKGTSSTANELNLFSSGTNGFGQAATAMPTILESSSSNVMPQAQQLTSTMNSSSLDRRRGSSGVRQIINTIKNTPHRLSQGLSIDHHRMTDEESSNLTRNMLD